MEILLAVAVVAVLGVGSVLVSRWLHRKRVAELTAWAQTNGWTYTEHAAEMVDRFVGVPFGQGFGRSAKHLLSTTMGGRPVVAFEYSYKERRGSGKDRRTVTYTFQIVATTLPAARPTLQVTHEHLGTKLLGAVGLDDLQLESEEFNRAFRISADDQKFAYDVLHPRTMEWMLSDPRARELSFRFERSDVLSWENGRLNAQRAAWAATYLLDVVDRVPQFVWK
jgi:uncharacterized protein DUF3137